MPENDALIKWVEMVYKAQEDMASQMKAGQAETREELKQLTTTMTGVQVQLGQIEEKLRDHGEIKQRLTATEQDVSRAKQSIQNLELSMKDHKRQHDEDDGRKWSRKTAYVTMWVMASISLLMLVANVIISILKN